MLVFTDRSFETLTLADTPEIPLLDDELNENTDTGTAILSVRIPKINKDVEKIEVGNFVFATDYKEDVKAFEVIELEETRHYKDILAEDTGLDLLNDEAGPIKMSGTLEEFIAATLGTTSAWEIGFIEIDPKKRMTLEYTAHATQTKRIAQIAGRFGCEVSYNFEFQGNTVAKKLVNFHVRRGKDTGRRLEIGKEIEDVKRTVSITDLCTAVRPIGQTVQKVVKTAIPFNLLNDSNRETTTRNYKVGQWTLSEPIRAGDEVTLTFKGVIGKDQRFRIYNSGSNHALAFLENVKEDIYSATFLWSEGDEGNTSLWAYQYPDKSPDNNICKIEWAVLTREKQVADKWVPSIADEMGSISAETDQESPEVEDIVVTNSKIDMLIAWFTSKEGIVGYDQNTRQGPKNYDCSSAVSYAARHAGFMPNSVGLPATGALWDYGNAGRYFHQISKSEVRRGDLFVSRTSGSSRGGTGHTGIFLSPSTIIHCTVGGRKRGIMRTPATSSWFGAGVRFYRWNDTDATKTTTKTGDYWTSSDLTKHDLGKTLQGITATQLNNWIKAVSPSSPFNGNGDLFLEAQRRSGLDVRYIIAHAAHESAWGTSNIARKNKNYFGIGAIDSDPFNGSKKYANADLATGIVNGVNWIKKNYYNRGQTTLYKMRFNGGVHEYATDPKWHTKIANIMKKSEKYTQPAKLGITGTSVPTSKPPTGALIPVPEVKYEDKTVEVDTTLVGYQYDDGRYVVNPAGEICDREGLEKWGRFKGVGVETWGYILRVYESEAQTPKTLFQAGLNFLKKNNTPRVEYEIGLSHIPEDINLGDTVRIIDHDYQPALYLEARLIELTISKTNPKLNKATFSNFEEKEGGILDRILELQDTANSVRWDFDTQPYNMNLISRNGNIFKDGLIETTLIVELTKAGINQVSSVDKFTWERISEYPDKVKISDEVWNDIKSTHTGNELTLNNDDIDFEATFICQAIKDDIVVATATYNIKDLTVGIFTQEEEPDRTLLSWGDIWKWDDGAAPFKRVWKGDHWEDTVTNRDLELIELTPGPPGADGKDGMPGEPGADGKTSYTHFAYADSSDGVVGFTTTTTPGKKYIGMYVDFTKADSDDPSDYAWSQFKGEDGQDGTDGIPGKPGEDGKTPYFHQAWANSADGITDFSTTVSADKIYIGTYVDFTKEDSEDPDKYKWIKVRGNDGEQGPPGTDGKTGSLGRNLLKNSNILEGKNSTGRLGYWQLDGDVKNNEEVTVTLNADLPSDRWVKLFDYNESTELATLTKNENGFYSATFLWKTINTDKVSVYIGNIDPSYTYTTIDDYQQSINNGTAVQDKNYGIMYAEDIPDINAHYDGVEYDFNWITLQRGDIPALDWSSSVEEIKESIDEKTGEINTKVEELEVHLQQYPPAESITKTAIDVEKTNAYLEALKTAIESDALTLQDRLAIIEANVGAGKLSIEAITTYFEFGEEGVLIGKQDEQVKLNLSNNALEIIDGDKVVARFANNQTETPNLKVLGVFEFGYHMASKMELNNKKYTVIRPV